MLNFAYGSNLCQRWLLSRVPCAQYEFVARLPGHELRFHKRSKDGSGKGNAWYTGIEHDVVWGAVVSVPGDEKPFLDQAEGLGHGYTERSLKVFDTVGEAHQVHGYIASASHIDDSLQPYVWYLRLISAGARALSLPVYYIESLLEIPTRVDMDRVRAKTAEVECGQSGPS